jgi:hypothetical protein
MGKIVPLTFLVMFVFVLVSCESDISNTNIGKAENPIHFEDIEAARSFTVTTPGTAVIKDDAAWTDLWEQYWNTYDGQGRKTPPPRIAFDEEMVLAVFYGSGYSGCSNRVDVIEDVVHTWKRIEVRIGSLSFDDLGPCTAIVYPLQMVKVRRSGLPVVFVGDIPE